MKLIDKDALVAEIEKLNPPFYPTLAEKISYQDAIKDCIDIIYALEVKGVDTWHLQEKEDIYDAIEDWGLYKFACIMKDGTIQRFTGNMDEDYEGHISVHIDGVNNDYDNVDDIVKWIEYT